MHYVNERGNEWDINERSVKKKTWISWQFHAIVVGERKDAPRNRERRARHESTFSCRTTATFAFIIGGF